MQMRKVLTNKDNVQKCLRGSLALFVVLCGRDKDASGDAGASCKGACRECESKVINVSRLKSKCAYTQKITHSC